MAEISNTLPPGWDCKFDARTSRYYFINHYTKQTTWEDPRLRYRQIQNTPTHITTEHIPLQHGSPEFRRNYVYPSQTCPQPAFQMPKTVPVQDLSNLRGMARGNNGTVITPKAKETTLAQVPTDTEQAVSKISTMFPTVPETHIRMLMKKYMKSIFPQVEETILLEVLGNNENNVQKASEALKEMGYEKKDMKLIKPKSSSVKSESNVKGTKESVAGISLVPKILTQDEKNAIKAQMQEKYRSIPERVVVLALESAEFNIARAQQILDVVIQEETSIGTCNSVASTSNSIAVESSSSDQQTNKIEESNPAELLKKSKSSLITPSPSIHALQTVKLDNKVRRTKEKKNSIREPLQENTVPDSVTYQSAYLMQSTGPNTKLAKGSDNKMLLEDYVSWDGPDPRLHSGKSGLARGPDRSLLKGRTVAHGPNPSLRKGPACSLAQGSLYNQMQTITITESRGK